MSRAKMSTSVFPPGEEPEGATEFERFDSVMKRLLAAPKVGAKAEEKRQRGKVKGTTHT